MLLTPYARLYRLLILILVLMPLCGCWWHTPGARVESPQFKPPQHWSTIARDDGQEPLIWLEDLTDPRLEQLIVEGVGQNFSLKAAAARMAAASARARLVGSDRLPAADLEFSAARRRSVSGGSGSTGSSIGLNGAVRWEIDLWQRLSYAEQAALSEAAATTADYRAAELSLAANIARGWFRLTEAELQLQLAEHTEESFRQSLQIIEEQYRSGLTSALDLRLARSSLTNAQAARADRERLLDSEQRALELLLGRYPAGRITGATKLLSLREKVPAGLPSSLLDRRPDLRAAALRLQAAGQSSAAAQRNRLPVFQLTGAAGTAGDKLYQLLDWDYLVWSLAGSLTQSLFDGGRRAAEQDIAVAEVDRQLADYADVMLIALREVEVALAAENSLQQQEQALRLSVEESLEAQNLAEQRYRQGLEGIITLLETQRRAFTAQIAQLRTSRLRLENRVDLHLALGGSYTPRVQMPEMTESP
jgi:NodT family efflux transporter outer membrane factor (OMF) lipoprotein